MKIYRIRPISNAKGNFLFKQVVQRESVNWRAEVYAKIDANLPVEMKWNWGCKTKKLSDLVPSTAPGLLLTVRAANAMAHLFPVATRFIVTIDGKPSFIGIDPKNFNTTCVMIDHAFRFEGHHYPMVTEVFKKDWEANGFFGAVFEEIAIMDDGLFVHIE